MPESTRAATVIQAGLAEFVSSGKLMPGKVLVFLVPALVTLALSLSFWQGMRATDDLGYAQMAISLVREGGPSAVISHHQGRLGLISPLAILFSMFGVCELSLAALPLACTVLT